MKYCLSVLSFWFLVTGSDAFSQQLKWEDKSFDFGTVSEWNSPPAVFRVTNTGKEKIMFLPMFYQREMYVDIPRRKIEPGETVELKIYIYTEQTGPFTKKATVWIDKSNDPIDLTVRGTIKSLYKNALTACPSFWPKDREEEKKEIVFIPKETTAGYGLPEKYDTTKVQQQPVTVFTSNLNEQYDENLTPALSKGEGEEETFEVFTSNINEQYNETTVVAAETAEQRTDTVTENPDELSREKFGANNIVMLIDESGSMKRDKKMEMLKTAIKELVKVMRGIDKLTIITYAASSEVLLPTTTADKKDEIYALIDSLTPYGWTNGVSGMNTAYDVIDKNFVENGNNQLILATDGEFNSGDVTESSFTDMVKANAAKGTRLSIVGFGQNEKALKLMKKMAGSGEGNFLQILPGSTDTGLLVEEIKRNSERR